MKEQKLIVRYCLINDVIFHPTNIPAIVAVSQEASAPPIMALIPNFAKSDLRSGAIAPIPPIWMAIELKLANPHKA